MTEMTAPETDNELLFRMRGGDEEAFVTLYRHMSSPIYRYVMNLTGSASQAEDVTQEVFLVLIRGAAGFDADRGTLGAYLFGIARKQVLRLLESNRFVTEPILVEEFGRKPQDASANVDLMADLLHHEGLESLRRAVVSLPKRYREVVVLCDLEEMDYTQVAVLLDIPIGTVRSRLHRARALLLDKLRQKRDPKRDVAALDPARSLI
jgi:RNA polymerase sigma-70 factor (ECF subfamily)